MLIWRPLKLATPLEAATDVVPAAKLPEDSATWMVSLEPVLPVVIVLPYWSSMVTPTDTVPPAVMEARLGRDDQLVLGGRASR